MSNVKKKTEATTQPNNTYAPIMKRYNDLLAQYSGALPSSSIYMGFGRASESIANNPTIQNQRVKAISTLPADISKEDLGNYLRKPYGSEIPLRQTSVILKTTAYPYYKIIKTASDIPTYRYYARPQYVEASEMRGDKFKRTARLIDKFNKTLCPEKTAHKIAGQALTFGKAFYTVRYDVDKIHNRVNYAFLQQLPEDRCFIVGYNNISGYTVSFDLMYFTQPGCDWRQFGDLFEPYLEDFNRIFEEPRDRREKFVYASEGGLPLKVGDRKMTVYPNAVNPESYGNPRIWSQNGRFAYYVTLPIDRVWTFEIDDTNPAVISPFSGLLLTYAQQADYEAAQLSLLLSPLIKIFTGEIPYKKDMTADDMFALSMGGRAMFTQDFADTMTATNTGGTALFSAPLENIKSHDFAESANANKISETFNKYGMEKAGLAGLIPVTDDVKAAQVDASERIENRFVTATIYPQFERMMNYLYSTLNLPYEWVFKMFGTIFDEKETRKNAGDALSRGDISAYYILSALDGESILDKITMLDAADVLGINDKLAPPPTSYTQSGDKTAKTETKEVKTVDVEKTAGRPETEEMTEAKEKSVDMGYSEA